MKGMRRHVSFAMTRRSSASSSMRPSLSPPLSPWSKDNEGFPLRLVPVGIDADPVVVDEMSSQVAAEAEEADPDQRQEEGPDLGRRLQEAGPAAEDEAEEEEERGRGIEDHVEGRRASPGMLALEDLRVVEEADQRRRQDHDQPHQHRP